MLHNCHYLLNFSLKILLVSILNDIQAFLTKSDDECATPDYPRNLTEEDSAFSFTISEEGMKKYILCGIQSSSVFFTQAVIPDIQENINLGITQIQFTLSDIHMQDLTVKGVDVALDNDNLIQASLKDCFVQMDLQWKFQQTSYPYLGDQGSGKIIMSGVDVYVAVESFLSQTCQGHFDVNIQSAYITFDALKIELSGGNSWIYQSMIDLILSSLQDDIADVISDIICNSLVDLMNSNFNKNGYYFPYAIQEEIIKDDRFVSGWQVGYGLMYLLYSGYIYNMNNLTDEYINSSVMIHQSIPYQFNSELQFSIDLVGFDNFYYIFNEYYKAYNYQNQDDNTTFELVEAPKSVLENVCILTNYTYNVTVNGTSQIVLFQLSGTPQYRTDQYSDPQAGSRNVTQIYFNYSLYQSNITDSQQQIEDYFQNNVLSFINNQLKNYNYQIANTPFMDFAIMNWYFDCQQQHLRIYGQVPEICGVLQ